MSKKVHKKPRKIIGLVSHVVCKTKEAENAFHEAIFKLSRDVYIGYEQSLNSWVKEGKI